MTKSGVNMLVWIAGPLNLTTLAGWWSVFHQSTENLIIGRLIAPTSAKIEAAFAPRDLSSKEW